MLEFLEEKWEAIRSQLNSVWHDLTDTDLEKIRGSVKDTVTFLKAKYGLKEEEIIEKLEHISDELNKGNSEGKDPEDIDFQENEIEEENDDDEEESVTAFTRNQF